MVILVVDDSGIMRNRVIEALQPLAEVSRVLQAASGTEAIAALRAHNVHLAFVDIRLAAENGLTLISKLRQIAPELKICMLTNYPYRQYRERALALGADYFLAKASDFHRLTGIVQEVERICNKTLGT